MLRFPVRLPPVLKARLSRGFFLYFFLLPVMGAVIISSAVAIRSASCGALLASSLVGVGTDLYCAELWSDSVCSFCHALRTAAAASNVMLVGGFQVIVLISRLGLSPIVVSGESELRLGREKEKSEAGFVN